MNILLWLQDWYRKNCDGCWEHLYGIKIDNIDNPGWMVKIDLTDTPLEFKKFSSIEKHNGECDWMICRKNQDVFEGTGDSDKLIPILEIFRKWAES